MLGKYRNATLFLGRLKNLDLSLGLGLRLVLGLALKVSSKGLYEVQDNFTRDFPSWNTDTKVFKYLKDCK